MPEKPVAASKNAVNTFRETIESLVVAFILAFVFRAFVVEAFVIPTGSMADTLRGKHYRLTCPACGYEYNYGFIPSKFDTNKIKYSEEFIPKAPFPIVPENNLRNWAIPQCPMCRAKAPIDRQWVNNGDRILVMKYLYQFVEPKIWDVVVFKNPTDPTKNFIKRLIATPGQTIQIIDGDIYIDGQIQHKPRHVQDILWQLAWDNNYQPVKPGISTWKQPFSPDSAGSKWTIDTDHHCFCYAPDHSIPDRTDALDFSSDHLSVILNNYHGYNGPFSERFPFYASDLKFAANLMPTDAPAVFSIRLGKYGRTYRADINLDGNLAIVDEHSGQTLDALAREPITQPTAVSFAILDHQFILDVGDDRLVHTGPNEKSAWGYNPDRPNEHIPQVALIALGGAFHLENLKLFRDLHYTNIDIAGHVGRGTEARPFSLNDDEFFVMGDNTSSSYDSRFWSEGGIGNGKEFREGVVPRDYLIGKALFVYWPAGFHPLPDKGFALVPNVGQMRFIH